MVLPPDDHVRNNTFKRLKLISKEIRWFGDSLLRQTAIPFSVSELGSIEARKMATELIEVLKQTRDHLGIGRGLAAPQIGILKRMFVIYNSDVDKFDTFINPVVNPTNGKYTSYYEMCLSGLPMAGEVIRPWEVQLGYYDLEGKHHELIIDSILSRIVQHENDHLDGILFIDRADLKTLYFEFDWATFKERNRLVIGELCYNSFVPQMIPQI